METWGENDPVVKSTGGGRGGQGGATAAQYQQGQDLQLKARQDAFKKSGQPQINLTQNNDGSWLDTALTGIRGFGEGATAGLIKYPQAVVNSLVNDMPYKQALSDVRAQNEELSRTHPLSFTGGQLLGGVALGAATGGEGAVAQGGTLVALLNRLRAAGQSIGTIGTAAATGAVSGATQNDYTGVHDLVRDTVVGGGVGAGAGALAKGMGWLAGKPGNVLKKELTSKAGGMTSQEADVAMRDPKLMELLDTYGYNAISNIKDIVKGSAAPIVGGGMAGAAAGAAHAAWTGGNIGQEALAGAAAGAATTLAVTKAKALSEAGAATNALTKSVSGKILPILPEIVSGSATSAAEQAGQISSDMNKTPDNSWGENDPVVKSPRIATTGVRG